MVSFNYALSGTDSDRDQFDRSAVLCVRRYAVRAHESIAHAAQHYRSDTPGVPAALNRVAGAMLQHFNRSVLEHRVRSGFEYKGRFTPAMRGIPVETISHPHVELLGAARLLLNS